MNWERTTRSWRLELPGLHFEGHVEYRRGRYYWKTSEMSGGLWFGKLGFEDTLEAAQAEVDAEARIATGEDR